MPTYQNRNHNSVVLDASQIGSINIKTAVYYRATLC